MIIQRRLAPGQPGTIKLLKEYGDKKIPPNKIMRVRVDYGEVHLGRTVKAAGGRWNSKKKVWELPYREIVSLGLEDRIVYDYKVSYMRNNLKRKPP